MNPQLLEKLINAGKDPEQYGIGQTENEIEIPELEEPAETLLSHLGEMVEIVDSSSTEEVMSFISEILKLKGF